MCKQCPITSLVLLLFWGSEYLHTVSENQCWPAPITSIPTLCGSPHYVLLPTDIPTSHSGQTQMPPFSFYISSNFSEDKIFLFYETMSINASNSKL